MSLRFEPTPALPCHYRWYYVDVSGEGFCAVAIFMMGAVFSPGALRNARRGQPPQRYSAVNFALYANGRRRSWVFSPHAHPTLADDTLSIGASRISYGPDEVRVEIDDHRAPIGGRIKASLRLSSLSPPSEVLRLHPEFPHSWQVLAPRARATLTLGGTRLSGFGYHDTNWGEELLGERLGGWRWQRLHFAERSEVGLDTGRERFVVGSDGQRTQVLPVDSRPGSATRLSAWGLRLPTHLGELPVAHVLESAPFYARVAAQAPGVDALGEVADFARFNSPYYRWMAHFRQRRLRAA